MLIDMYHFGKNPNLMYQVVSSELNRTGFPELLPGAFLLERSFQGDLGCVSQGNKGVYLLHF